MTPEIRSLVGTLWGRLCCAVLASIPVSGFCSTESSAKLPAWKDVQSIGAPTRYSVDVERYRFGTLDVRNPDFYPIPQSPVTRESYLRYPAREAGRIEWVVFNPEAGRLAIGSNETSESFAYLSSGSL